MLATRAGMVPGDRALSGVSRHKLLPFLRRAFTLIP